MGRCENEMVIEDQGEFYAGSYRNHFYFREMQRTSSVTKTIHPCFFRPMLEIAIKLAKLRRAN